MSQNKNEKSIKNILHLITSNKYMKFKSNLKNLAINSKNNQ